MTEPQVTMSGPAQLRHIAKQRGLPILSKELNQLAALWEADLSNATGLIADATLRAERAEARADELGRRLASKTMALNEAEESVDRLQATKNDLTAEIKALYAARPTLSEWAELTQAWSKAEAALERALALENKRAVSARNVAEWVRGLWADYCRQSGEAGVSVIMNQEILEKLKRARALIPEMVVECVQKRKYVPCGCGGDHCSYCTYSETWHKLAAALAEGGRP